MTYNPDKHHRRSIRLRDYDYSSTGAYFVTICTRHRECLFGEIVNNEIALSDAGRIVEQQWRWLEQQYYYMQLDRFIIMPNHFHGIIQICDDEYQICGDKCRDVSRNAPTNENVTNTKRKMIGCNSHIYKFLVTA